MSVDPLARLSKLAEKLYTDGKLSDEDLEPFFSQSDRLLLIADAQGISVAANPKWKAELGYDASTMKGKPYLELVHPDDQAETQAAAASLFEGGVTNFFNRYRNAAGQYEWLSWVASKYDQGHLTYASAEVVRDPETLKTLAELANTRRDASS